MTEHPSVLLIAAGLIIGVASPSAGEESSSLKLINATQIETNRIYESAVPSKLAQAFNKVLRRPDAKQSLVRVFQEAKTDAGRIYALTGLHKIDATEYRRRLGQMSENNNVRAMWYDVIRIFTIRDLAKMIDSGELENILLPRQNL